MQAAAPGQELVRCIRRDVSRVLDTDPIKSVVVGIEVAGILAASATAEHNFDFLFEAGSILDIVCGNHATAKEANMREHVQMF